MFLISIFFAILFNIVLSQQGIFDPSTYTESSCTGSNRWTTWFDTNDPNLTQGDLEVTEHIKRLFPAFMCSSPTAIEVRRDQFHVVYY